MSVINKLRSQCCKNPITIWDDIVAGYCFQHSWAMAKEKNIDHAASHHLEGWSECVAMSMVDTGNNLDILNDMVFNVLCQSEEHKNILLNANTIAGSLVIDNWVAYLTIRCK